MEEEKRACMSHPESWWSGKRRRRTGGGWDKLAARVQKLEERVRGMHEKMWEAMSFTGTATVEESTNWRRDGAGGEWQRWKGEWWIRVGSSNLNSRQRRRVSRDLRRLIAREQNEVLKLLRELKSALWKGDESAETCNRVTQGGGSSDGETEKNKGGDDNDDDGVRSRGGDSGRSEESWSAWRVGMGQRTVLSHVSILNETQGIFKSF